MGYDSHKTVQYIESGARALRRLPALKTGKCFVYVCQCHRCMINDIKFLNVAAAAATNALGKLIVCAFVCWRLCTVFFRFVLLGSPIFSVLVMIYIPNYYQTV